MDPVSVLRTARRLGAAPGRAVMVGDNHHDVEAAHAAGIAAVAVTYGYAHRAPDALGAERLIDRFAELPDALCALATDDGDGRRPSP
jgi:phosphoglycolate phosphatase